MRKPIFLVSMFLKRLNFLKESRDTGSKVCSFEESNLPATCLSARAGEVPAYPAPCGGRSHILLDNEGGGFEGGGVEEGVVVEPH